MFITQNKQKIQEVETMGETANIIKMCAEAFKTKSEFEKGMIIGIMLNPASFKDDHKEDHKVTA